MTKEQLDPLSQLDLPAQCDEAAFCCLQRAHAITAPNVDLRHLERDDEVLAAHIDVLAQSGAVGWDAAVRMLDEAGAAELFVATAVARSVADWRLVRRLGSGSTALEGAVASALGWLGESRAAPYLAELWNESDPSGSCVGVAALDELRLDDVAALTRALSSSSSRLVARSLQTVGDLGRTELAQTVLTHLRAKQCELRWQAVRTATLFGDRSAAIETLEDFAVAKTSRCDDALWLLLLASDRGKGHSALQSCRHEGQLRARISGAGLVGDASYVPWLIDQMTNPAVARIAAEAFVHITGADFNLDQLEAMPPEDFEDGPSDDPDDDDVELPEDIALPWPDVERIKAWWMEHRSEFTPGQKLFLGKPITPEHCIHVLKTGYQRQRVIAAHYRCLIQPGTVLFPTSAPAWRQQKLLAAM